MLKNHMEVLVDSHLKGLLAHHEHIAACSCCQLDVQAIALNHLKPYYTRTGKGLLFTKMKELDLQFQSDITQALVRAIQLVEANPNHEGDGPCLP